MPLVCARASMCLAAEVVTRTQIVGWLCSQSEANTAKTLSRNAARVGTEGVRFGRDVLFPNGERFGDRAVSPPLPELFLFLSSKWSDMVHSGC